MKNKYISSIIFLTFFVTSYSQSVLFLNTPTDARSAAMGNTGYVLSSPFAVQNNAASVMPEYNSTIGVGATVQLWQPQAADATLINVAGYTKIKKIGVLAGFRSNKTGEIAKTDGNGTTIGSFAPSENAIELGLGYGINSNISLGVSFRHISSRMDENVKSSAFASDISMLYYRERLRLGLGIANLGSKIDYGNAKYNLPTRIKSGAAYQFSLNDNHSLLTAADFFYQLTPGYNGIASGLGVEYNYKKLFAFRTGYHYESKLVGASYASIGLGTSFQGLSLDFAYNIAAENNPMNQTMLFTLKWER